MEVARATGYPRWRVTHVAETGSTNDDLVVAAAAGEAAGVVLVADHQRAGRGRVGRRWEAPPGSALLVSVLVRPGSEAVARPHGATQAMAMAARQACRDVAGFTPALKWPNDLLAGDRKLAGILAEARAHAGRIEAVVIGLGLNVSWPPEPPPADYAFAISAEGAGGCSVDRDRLLQSVLEHLGVELDRWRDAGDALTAAYRAALGTLGCRVRVERPGETVEGLAVDVDELGRLVVDTAAGRRTIDVGDVIHLRPV
jgi:BirA family biotin operon repressor/biotin-[acetyl-CoA-carboxylase] ligase